ncbi:unnamed protein product [Urochloa decumbens]|uniref:CRIB domain-containing protein n=2 Tax=Urochloa decumbens TaxID=240449 RepID=A0ABC9DLR2_9POAL
MRSLFFFPLHDSDNDLESGLICVRSEGCLQHSDLACGYRRTYLCSFGKASPMAISIKGIFRGLKIIAQIFMQREHEIEIGYPTNVRHVSHIGFDASGSCPSWMNGFRGVEEVPAGGGGAASISSAAAQSSQTSWASLDFEQPVGAGVLPAAAEASTADSSAAFAGTANPRGVLKKQPAARPKKARAASPAGSSARSPSWRSAASFAAACRDDSGELRPAGVRAA